ncbi:hypothetical protein POSPLADRAFT_1061572 [Postia placenta MAD-698-R-SB12]|uniref:Protein-S-isoprenylcysteine O-methyltransferase n=1 Tax=Postia placenta MAD-698-R-SB12 TaxID=670580 RepID=A0A1X6MLT7_9APHY|nr:hypothetical protein POSPLADRAFT_1061572 [Postia placenta MAD-698-R-SB12]OSX57364.1 hypothetical protein POSPLADRAFT_1061572 [Postia placenta MAD-698-R-SB12]
MLIAKVPFLIAGTLGVYTTFTPPQRRAVQGERPKSLSATPLAYSPLQIADDGRCDQAVTCAGGLLEIAVILAYRYPSSPASRSVLAVLVNGPTSLASQIHFSPAFYIGTALAVAGGIVRYQCYRTMGRFFTFEITMRNGHRLVTTGPYAYVRHPSYTGWLVAMVGPGICCASPGSWFRECRIYETAWGKFGAALYVFFCLLSLVPAVVRPPTEDRLLREQFCEEWDAWARRVPYRLIPYVY